MNSTLNQRKILKIILEGKKDEEVNRIIEYPGIGPGDGRENNRGILQI